MLVNLLLIGIPISASFAFGAFTAWLCTKLPRLRPWLVLMATAVSVFLMLLTGAWFGVLVSCEINRVFYNYEALSSVLPSGIYLWYGFGPGLTPQFEDYWRFVRVAKLVAWPLFVFLSLRFPKPTPLPLSAR
jgi:hypothetical protein